MSMRDRMYCSAAGSNESISTQNRSNGSSARATLTKPSVRKLKFRSTRMSTSRPAHQLVDGNAEGARLDVEQRVLDGGDRLLDDAARRLPAHRVEGRDDRFARARVSADHEWHQPVDGRADAETAERLVGLAPAHDAVVGGDLEKVERALAGVGVQVLETSDLHAIFPSRPRIQT